MLTTGSVSAGATPSTWRPSQEVGRAFAIARGDGRPSAAKWPTAWDAMTNSAKRSKPAPPTFSSARRPDGESNHQHTNAELLSELVVVGLHVSPRHDYKVTTECARGAVQSVEKARARCVGLIASRVADTERSRWGSEVRMKQTHPRDSWVVADHMGDLGITVRRLPFVLRNKFIAERLPEPCSLQGRFLIHGQRDPRAAPGAVYRNLHCACSISRAEVPAPSWTGSTFVVTPAEIP